MYCVCRFCQQHCPQTLQLDLYQSWDINLPATFSIPLCAVLIQPQAVLQELAQPPLRHNTPVSSAYLCEM